MEKFKVFHRTWWTINKNGEKEPRPGHCYYLATVESERLAREVCNEWNANHEAGELSDKAEYEGC